jgi:hypothetical protein
MTTKQLEKRVARLENELEQLKADLKCTSQGWRSVVGTHEGSSTFESIVREMRRLRREDYQEAAGENKAEFQD